MVRALLSLLALAAAVWSADPLRPVFNRAAAALSSGDYAEAERGFQQVLKAAPHHVGALGNLGVVYSRTNRPARAVDVYKRALSASPGDKGILLNLGIVYIKQESYWDALPLFQKLAADPGNLQARELLATCLLNTGQVEAAIRSFEALRKDDPQNGGLLYLLGVAYLKQKEIGKARQVLEEVIAKADPPKASFVLGKAYYETARFEEAAELYRKTLELDPNYPGAHLELGKVYVSQRNPEAVKELAAALRQDPNNSEAHYFLGGLLMQANRIEEAIPHLERARQLNPGFWGTYFYLGKAKFQMNQARQAVPLLEKAAELNPGETSIYYQLGRALSECGREEEANRVLRRVAEIKARELERVIEGVGKK